MKVIFAIAMSLAASATCLGQTVYGPVRYQYGTGTGQLFYGGADPSMPYQAGSLNTPGVQALQQKFGIQPGVARPLRYDVPLLNNARTPVYSDLQPYTDVGQLGFTQNDARNEAYANVPRISTKFSGAQLTVAPPTFVAQSVAGNPLLPTLFTQVYQVGAPVVTQEALPAPTAPTAEVEAAVIQQTDQRAKAIPLLTWAKAEKTRNPALYQALLKEAAKWDVDASAKAAME